MAITTLDGAIAGFKAPEPLLKVGITMSAVGAARGYTPWYVAGRPSASVAPSVGINGQAVDATIGTTVQGRIPRTNPVSGNAYLARWVMQQNITGSLWLIDRIWQNSGLVVTSTTAQAITPATAAARDINGESNGAGIMAAMEWSATGGAGTPTVTLTFTDQNGNTGKTGTITAVTTPPVGTFEIFNMPAGVTGVRAPTSFIQSATRTSGTMHLVLFRVLAQLDITTANVAAAMDVITGGMPRIYDNSVLQWVFFPSATTATTMLGTYIETQG
jgi:hypothetical protein